MKKKKYGRKEYFTDKSFQIKFIGVIFLIQICVATMVCFGVSWLHLFVFDTGKVVCRTNYCIFVQWAIIIGFTSLILLIWGISYTHRVVGPVHRTRRLLQAAASGDIPSGNINFRKKDYFKELEKDLAACFETMENYRKESKSS